MKNLLILFILAFSCNCMAGNNEPAHVIITAGQSNTDGRVPNDRLPDYINSDTITNLVYDVGDWYFSADGKYKDYYYVMAFVNWSKAPVILSMHQTEEEAQEKIKLLAIELNSK